MNISTTLGEVDKIKTASSNIFCQVNNDGMVFVHARSTVMPIGEVAEEQKVTNDDIQIDGIEYYKDLGN
jgi:hypothetical protein